MTAPSKTNVTGDNAMPNQPDTTVDVREVFGIDVDWQVPPFTTRDEHVPELPGAESEVAITVNRMNNFFFLPLPSLALLCGVCLNQQ